MASEMEENINVKVEEIPEIDRYLRSVSVCNNLALLASQGTMQEYAMRISVLSQLYRLWADNVLYVKIVVCSDEEALAVADCEETFTALSTDNVNDDADDGICSTNDNAVVASDSAVELKDVLADMCELSDEISRETSSSSPKSTKYRSLKPMLSCLDCGELLRTQTLLRKHMSTKHGRRRRKVKQESRDASAETDGAVAALAKNVFVAIPLSDADEDLNVAIHETVVQLSSGIPRAGSTAANDQRRFMCYICGLRYRSLAQLNLHLVDHEGVRAFSCAVCGASYKRKSDLKRHMFKHTEFKSFQCLVCSKQFTYRHSLRIHMRLHSGDLRYVCMHCDHRVSTPGALSTHMRKHSLDKAYACRVCAAPFKHPSSLSRHMQMHM